MNLVRIMEFKPSSRSSKTSKSINFGENLKKVDKGKLLISICTKLGLNYYSKSYCISSNLNISDDTSTPYLHQSSYLPLLNLINKCSVWVNQRQQPLNDEEKDHLKETIKKFCETNNITDADEFANDLLELVKTTGYFYSLLGKSSTHTGYLTKYLASKINARSVPTSKLQHQLDLDCLRKFPIPKKSSVSEVSDTATESRLDQTGDCSQQNPHVEAFNAIADKLVIYTDSNQNSQMMPDTIKALDQAVTSISRVTLTKSDRIELIGILSRKYLSLTDDKKTTIRKHNFFKQFVTAFLAEDDYKKAQAILSKLLISMVLYSNLEYKDKIFECFTLGSKLHSKCLGADYTISTLYSYLELYRALDNIDFSDKLSLNSIQDEIIKLLEQRNAITPLTVAERTFVVYWLNCFFTGRSELPDEISCHGVMGSFIDQNNNYSRETFENIYQLVARNSVEKPFKRFKNNLQIVAKYIRSRLIANFGDKANQNFPKEVVDMFGKACDNFIEKSKFSEIGDISRCFESDIQRGLSTDDLTKYREQIERIKEKLSATNTDNSICSLPQSDFLFVVTLLTQIIRGGLDNLLMDIDLVFLPPSLGVKLMVEKTDNAKFEDIVFTKVMDKNFLEFITVNDVYQSCVSGNKNYKLVVGQLSIKHKFSVKDEADGYLVEVIELQETLTLKPEVEKFLKKDYHHAKRITFDERIKSINSRGSVGGGFPPSRE